MSKEHSSCAGFAMRAIHHAYGAYAGHGSLNPPVCLSSTHTLPTVEDAGGALSAPKSG